MSRLRPQNVAAAVSLRAGGLLVVLVLVGCCVAASPAAAAGMQNSRFGFAAGGDIQNFRSDDLARYLDGARAAHAGWIRIDINWNVIQYSGPASYNWTPFDNVVRAATARGMKVLATILYTPPWARPPGTGATYAPSNLADYADFVGAAVTRYAPMGVHAYEIWNEPNIANFWAPGPDPARYAQLLRMAYGAVKQVDRRATVVSGGLSPYGAYPEADSTHMNPLLFLRRIYANGARGSFDALGWHPASYPHGLSFARWSAWSQMAQTSPNARGIMRAHGDVAKRVWATEFGYPTGNTPRSVSEAAQARLVTRTYAALARWAWAGPAFLYTYHDSGTDKTEFEQNFGAVRYDYSPKPAYIAYQRAAATANR